MKTRISLSLLSTLILAMVLACQKEEINPLQQRGIHTMMEALDNAVVIHAKKGHRQMVPFKGYVIEVPYFDPAPVFCLDIPYPRGFRDIGGQITHLGNVAGGHLEFLNCNPGKLDGVSVFAADYVGEFHSPSGDKVFYEGTLTFFPDPGQEGISENVITGGTGKWDGASGHFRYYNITLQEDGTFYASIEGMITPIGAF